jgi:pimeloyl-ACP methyl ester carboxylesterase
MLGACASDLSPALLEARYTNAASRFLTVSDGTRVHVRDEGLQGGPVLVLLHGSNAALQSWEPWVRELAGRYRLVSLDFPGHGLTGPSVSRTYGGAAYVQVVDDVVRQLGINRFAVAGNSMGGAVAWQYAVAHPEKLTALILVDAAGYPRGGEGRPPLIFRLVRTPGVGEVLSRLPNRGLVESNLKDVIADDSLVTDAMVTQYSELLRRAGNRQATLDRMRAQPADPGAWQRIATIRAPTLILWGDADPWIPVSDAARFAADIPGARTIIYPGIGHLPQEEVPLQSAADVAAFLASLPARPAP